jgi:hypothetical protein
MKVLMVVAGAFSLCIAGACLAADPGTGHANAAQTAAEAAKAANEAAAQAAKAAQDAADKVHQAASAANQAAQDADKAAQAPDKAAAGQAAKAAEKAAGKINSAGSAADHAAALAAKAAQAAQAATTAASQVATTGGGPASSGTAAAENKSSAPLYTVKDGNKVDHNTLMGWKTWRALDCARCHGNEQQGLVGPSLVEGLKTLTKDQFHTTVMNGRPGTVMPSFKASKLMQENWQGLYAYLKGRSDEKIKPGHLYPIDEAKK